MGLAADWLRRDILGVAESGGLQAQAYWLSTTLALGAFLKVRPTQAGLLLQSGVTVAKGRIHCKHCIGLVMGIQGTSKDKRSEVDDLRQFVAERLMCMLPHLCASSMCAASLLRNDAGFSRLLLENVMDVDQQLCA